MKFKTHIVSTVLVLLAWNASFAAPSQAIQRVTGGIGNPPEVKTSVSISLDGTSTVSDYCARTKKKWPKPPKATGNISVSDPSDKVPFIAGDGAPKIGNRWIKSPNPLPEHPTDVSYTCANSRELSSGAHGFSWSATWTPTPAPCWSTPAFNATVTGGIVVWNPDGMGGTIYIPKLKSTTVKVAPDHKTRADKGRSRIQIGAGEEVNLVIENVPTPLSVDWQQSGNVDGLDAILHGVSNHCHATKPSGATGSGTITADVSTAWGNFQVDKTFTVFKTDRDKDRADCQESLSHRNDGGGYESHGPIDANKCFFRLYFRS